MRVALFRDFSFEAAHRNLSVAASPSASRLHGHSYSARVWLAGAIEEQRGWLVDFADIKGTCAPVIEMLDHRYLNDVEGVQDATLADIGRWLENHLRRVLPNFERCTVRILGESQFNPIVHPERSGTPLERCGFWFAAAHLLPMAAENHKCRRLHGHSFHIEIAASDTRELHGQLEEIFLRLDHHLLNEIPGLENPTSENLSRWIWEELSASQRHPMEIAVQETCTTGCVYRGE